MKLVGIDKLCVKVHRHVYEELLNAAIDERTPKDAYRRSARAILKYWVENPHDRKVKPVVFKYRDPYKTLELWLPTEVYEGVLKSANKLGVSMDNMASMILTKWVGKKTLARERAGGFDVTTPEEIEI